jgi:hypothetical protein
LCNALNEEVAKLDFRHAKTIRWEQALEAGEDIEGEVADAKPTGI